MWRRERGGCKKVSLARHTAHVAGAGYRCSGHVHERACLQYLLRVSSTGSAAKSSKSAGTRSVCPPISAFPQNVVKLSGKQKNRDTSLIATTMRASQLLTSLKFDPIQESGWLPDKAKPDVPKVWQRHPLHAPGPGVRYPLRASFTAGPVAQREGSVGHQGREGVSTAARHRRADRANMGVQVSPGPSVRSSWQRRASVSVLSAWRLRNPSVRTVADW